MNAYERIVEMRRKYTHTHSMTDYATLGPRGVGECAACDHARDAYRRAAEEGR